MNNTELMNFLKMLIPLDNIVALLATVEIKPMTLCLQGRHANH